DSSQSLRQLLDQVLHRGTKEPEYLDAKNNEILISIQVPVFCIFAIISGCRCSSGLTAANFTMLVVFVFSRREYRGTVRSTAIESATIVRLEDVRRVPPPGGAHELLLGECLTLIVDYKEGVRHPQTDSW
ncbi:hypothetical protein ACOME3_008882, partial [Neoechinorhynchus agilis]